MPGVFVIERLRVSKFLWRGHEEHKYETDDISNLNHSRKYSPLSALWKLE